jgi:ribosomal protein L24
MFKVNDRVLSIAGKKRGDVGKIYSVYPHRREAGVSFGKEGEVRSRIYKDLHDIEIALY